MTTTNDGWLDSWSNDRTHWHRQDTHPMLEKYLEKVTAGKKSCRFFFPLCGKAVDMKWLADLGHTVVGIDLADKAAKQFFEEQNLEYDVSPVENVPDTELYKSKDGKILIYKGDLFAVPRDILGKFDGMWDRGALVAINKEDRERYINLLVALMAPECRYLLSTFDYDPNVMTGPPHCIPDSEVQKLFADRVKLEHLQTNDHLSERWKQRGHTWMTESVFIIMPSL